jgi:hypothetical protein
MIHNGLARSRKGLLAGVPAMVVFLALLGAGPAYAGSTITVCASSCDYTTIAAAVSAASAGDTIYVKSPQTVTATITIDKRLTLKGDDTVISTPGPHAVFNVTAGGSRTYIHHLAFVATAKVAPPADHRIIILDGTDRVRVRHTSFDGNWTYNEPHVVRGLLLKNSTNFEIRDSAFRNIRQPAFFDNSSGKVRNNHADNTRGWVVDSTTAFDDVKFSKNRWGLNAVDIAYIRQPLATCSVTDAEIVEAGEDNNRAVVENQCHTLPPNGYSSTESTLSRVLVRAGAPVPVDEPGGPLNPYPSIQAALDRVAEGGTVFVENGAYTESLVFKKNGTRLEGQSRAGVEVTANGPASGWGIEITNLIGVEISDMTLKVPAVGPRPSYHLKVYQGGKLELEDLTFIGPGRTVNAPNRTGGVDINSVAGVEIEDVVARDYSRNGFAFTAQFTAGDPITRDVYLKDITADANAWAGVAFYTYNSSGSIGHTISGVTFSGHNAIANNDKGIEILGATDPQVLAGAAPTYAITSKGGNRVDVGRTAFDGNALYDIINYQPTGLKATDARFAGKRGKQMSSAERAATDAKILDGRDLPSLGIVKYR